MNAHPEPMPLPARIAAYRQQTGRRRLTPRQRRRAIRKGNRTTIVWETIRCTHRDGSVYWRKVRPK